MTAIGCCRFKSSLIGAAQVALKAEIGGAAAVTPMVQPVSIAYVKVHGVAMGRQYRPFFAWYGDMELLDHLFEAIRLGPVDIEITLHPPVPAEKVADRKAVTAYAQAKIGQGLAEILSSPTRWANKP